MRTSPQEVRRVRLVLSHADLSRSIEGHLLVKATDVFPPTPERCSGQQQLLHPGGSPDMAPCGAAWRDSGETFLGGWVGMLS